MNTRAYQLYILVKWEMLRLPYNAVLLFPGLLLPETIKEYVSAHFGPGYWAAYAACMLVANLFYCLGPLSEAYLLAFWGKQAWRSSYALYGLGTLFSFLWMGGWELVMAPFG